MVRMIGLSVIALALCGCESSSRQTVGADLGTSADLVSDSDGSNASDAGKDNDADGSVSVGRFLIENVSETNANVFWPTLEVRSNDSPAVYWIRKSNKGDSLWRATRKGGAWTERKEIYSPGFEIADLESSLDPEGKEHLVVAPYPEKNLPLQHGISGSPWKFEDVVLDHTTYKTDGGVRPVIVSGPSGVGVAFYAPDHDQLFYAWRSSSDASDWKPHLTPAFSQVVGIGCAIEGDGTPHLGYIQVVGESVHPFYARWDGVKFIENQNTFDFQTDPDPSVGDIAFGLLASGAPFFVLFDVKTESLVYYERTDWHTWTREVIDTNGDFSLTTSADRASDDTVFVAYFDETSRQLRLATRGSGNWQVETVIASTGGGTQVYQKVRLRVDANKTPHLAFQDYDLRAIRYATYAK